MFSAWRHGVGREWLRRYLRIKVPDRGHQSGDDIGASLAEDIVDVKGRGDDVIATFFGVPGRVHGQDIASFVGVEVRRQR
jgi:hypothetical protein